MLSHTMRFSILVVVLVTSAQAQSAAGFYPLNDGDTWTYERLERPQTRLSVLRGYRRVTVLSDTTIGGGAYKTARVEFLQFSQAVDSTAYCAVRVVEPEILVEWVRVRGTCEATESGFLLGSGNPVTEPFYVGGLRYDGWTRAVVSQQNPYRRVLTAEGVGAVETILSQSDATGNRMLLQKLVTATVGGALYGEMPGPTAWRAFQPLDVGDRRAYKTTYSRGGPTTYQTVTVTGQEAVDGLLYFRVVLTAYDAAFAVTGTEAQFWRHRDDLGCIVARAGSGSEACRDPSLLLAKIRTLVRTTTFAVGSQTVTARAGFDSYEGTPSISFSLLIAEGIGDVYRNSNSGGSGGGSGTSRTLIYVRSGSIEYGTPPSWAAWAPPTAEEEDAAADDAFAVRLAGPNPTRGAVALRVVVPHATSVHIDVYDVLGRRITEGVREVAAGGQSVTVDLTRQASGAYLIRVSVPDGAHASVPVTVY